MQELPQHHTAGVSSLVFSADGAAMCSTALDDTAALWDARTWQVSHALRGHTDSVNCCYLTPNSPMVLTGGDDGVVCFWDTRKSDSPSYKLKGFKDGVNDLKIFQSADGSSRLFTAVDDGILYVHDVTKPPPNVPLVDRFQVTPQTVNAVVFLPGVPESPEFVVATASEDNAVRLWKTQREGVAPDDKLITSVDEFQRPVNHLHFDNERAMLFCASANDVIGFGVSPEGKVDNDNVNAYCVHEDYIRGIHRIPGTAIMYTVSDDGTGVEWDVTKPDEPLMRARLHNTYVMASAVDAASTMLASGCEDASIRLWPLPLSDLQKQAQQQQ